MLHSKCLSRAFAGACKEYVRRFRGQFQASLGSVCCSRCDDFASPQLWTNSHVKDFSLSVPFLAAFAGACKGHFRMFRRQFRASQGCVCRSRCDGFAPPQLWTNSHVEDFSLSVPFLVAFSGACKGNFNIIRGQFVCSRLWYADFVAGIGVRTKISRRFA